jgi:predicted transposase YbfD/YdcC
MSSKISRASQGSTKVMKQFYQVVGVIEDPRVVGRCRHRFVEVLFMLFCTMLAGIDNVDGIHRFCKVRKSWFRKYLELPGGIPSADTFSRILAMLDAKAFEACFLNWVKDLIAASMSKKESSAQEQSHIAIDGKTIKGTDRSFNRGTRPVLVVNAYCSRQGIVLGQSGTDHCVNSEIQATYDCLDLLDVEEALITLDSGASNKKLIRKIREKKGHYLVPVKKNKMRLLREIEPLFQARRLPPEARLVGRAKTEEKNRGRTERRSCRVIDISKLKLEAGSMYQDLRFVIEVTRERTIKETRYLAQKTGVDGKQYYERVKTPVRIQRETIYYISSQKMRASEYLQKIRDHWKIENQLHWHLDVSFNEDQWRVRHTQAARNLSLLRKFAFNILKQDPSTKNLKAKIELVGWDPSYLDRLVQSSFSFIDETKSAA